MSLAPASGIGTYIKHAKKAIRFVRHGCANRPFYHIVVTETRKEQFDPVIEQLGSYDPMPNERNEQYLAFNFERIRYWLGQGAIVTRPVAEILGDAGFLPIHPRRYMTSWRNRARAVAEAAEKLAKVAEEAEKTQIEVEAAKNKQNEKPSEEKNENSEAKPQST